MKKINNYKLSAYLIFPSIIAPLILKFYSELGAALIYPLFGSYILITFKKLLSEKFSYHGTDKLIDTQIFFIIAGLMVSIIGMLTRENSYSFVTIDLISNIFMVIVSFIEIKIGKALLKDIIGYQDLFPIYGKSMINMAQYLIIIMIIIPLASLYEKELYIFLPLIVAGLICLVPALSAAIRNSIYLFKIFNRASNE